MAPSHLYIPTDVPDEPTDTLPSQLRNVIAHAAQARATDIHLDTWQRGAAVRLRIDGKVHPYNAIGAEETRRLINQVRAAAGMDIDAARESQEGHLRWHGPDRAIDMRVTDTPTAPDDRAVHLRILTRPDEVLSAGELGMRDEQREMLMHHLATGQGLMLIAGPTGAGKTTTLYALLGLENLARRITVTIEDPAEVDLPYIRQIEVDDRVGRGMAEGLRLALRMDPDVLGVGEVRDQASAQIAARAALGGRNVLATIHGHDAASAVHALHYFGVPFSVLAGALRSVVAQDLVRLLCPECREAVSSDAHQRKLFDQHQLDAPQEVYRPTGCSACRDIGYRGRTGVFQVAVLDVDTATALAKRPREDQIRELLRTHGTQDLATEALRKVASGRTSFAEVGHLLDD